MAYSTDITGEHFGRLVALRVCGKSGRENIWSCACSCGKVAKVRLSNLRNGNTVSCGCRRREILDSIIFEVE